MRFSSLVSLTNYPGQNNPTSPQIDATKNGLFRTKKRETGPRRKPASLRHVTDHCILNETFFVVMSVLNVSACVRANSVPTWGMNNALIFNGKMRVNFHAANARVIITHLAQILRRKFYSTTSTGSPSTSMRGCMPKPGSAEAAKRPPCRWGAPSAMLVVT